VSIFGGVCILLVDVAALVNLDGICKVMLLIYYNFVVIVRVTLSILRSSRMSAKVIIIIKDFTDKLRLGMALIHY